MQFEEFKEGDILDRYGHHVMLFKEFLTPEKTVLNVTRIKIIEASGLDWKVSEWEYLLVSIEDMEEEWNGFRYTTSSVILELASGPLKGGRTGPYVTRTRSAIVLYIANIIPRHRYWFLIFLISSITVGLTTTYWMTKRRKNKGCLESPLTYKGVRFT